MNNQRYPSRSLGIVTLVTFAFLACVVMLVSVKTGMLPWEMAWVDGNRLSSLVRAILNETRYELIALAIAAVNAVWFGIYINRMNSVVVDPQDHDDVDAFGGAEELWPETLESDVEKSAETSADANSGNGGSDDEAPRADRAIPANASDGEARVSLSKQLEIANSEVTRLRRELVSSRQQVVSAQKAKSQFLANMSHELRTPMNGIMGMTELLLNGVLPPRDRRFVQSINSSANSLLSIINDLLDFSKIESGSLYLERSRFRIQECVEDICGTLAESAHVKGIELICYVDELPTFVEGDGGRLRQILNNLISNAIAFTTEGEVVVRASRLEDSNGKQVFQFDVQDTGVGILPEQQATLFEAFTQADGSTTRRHGGIGIGLAISQQLIEKMGGKISFRSRLGEGTRFTFSVKLDPVDEDEQTGIVRRPLAGARVLVVDDNETNRTILFHQLSNWGLHVDSVESGIEALKALYRANDTDQPYDVLVLDLHMPEMDGVELARAIQADPAIAGVRALMLTSAVLDIETSELAAIGIDKYISKPARQSQLHDSLASLMPNAIPGVDDIESDASLQTVTARVLLAEDNVVNQDVAVGMFEFLGCDVTVAADGKMAVEACQKDQFDVIFMDCQMPNMDGYEATAAIKGNCRHNKETPIVALTANAMEGDRERCLQHGMSDYLSKPVRQNQLHAKLTKWAPACVQPDVVVRGVEESGAARGGQLEAFEASRSSYTRSSVSGMKPENRTVSDAMARATRQQDLGDTVASMDSTDADGLINMIAIGTIRDLQRPGKPDILTKVINVYFDKTPSTIAEMQSAAAAGDFVKIRESAHSLKSSSAYLGADGVSDKCKRLEIASQEEDLPTAEELVKGIAEEYVDVQMQLSALIQIDDQAA